MPAKPSWLLRIPDILDDLRALSTPVVDRASFERLFGVRRRQSIELLHRFGGYQAGKTFLADRRELINELERIASSGEFNQERKRHERLAEKLQEMRRLQSARRVAIPVPETVSASRLKNLPAGMRIRPGRLEVDFSGPEDLLAKLYALSQAVMNDYEEFCKADT